MCEHADEAKRDRNRVISIIKFADQSLINEERSNGGSAQNHPWNPQRGRSRVGSGQPMAGRARNVRFLLLSPVKKRTQNGRPLVLADQLAPCRCS